MNPGESLHISNQIFNRLKGYIVIENDGFPMKRAGQNVDIARQKFSERKWLSIYRQKPFEELASDRHLDYLNSVSLRP